MNLFEKIYTVAISDTLAIMNIINVDVNKRFFPLVLFFVLPGYVSLRKLDYFFLFFFLCKPTAYFLLAPTSK